MKTRIIVADPDWPQNDRRKFRKDNPTKQTRFGIGSRGRYESLDPAKRSLNMSLQDIYDLAPLVQAIAAPDCYLFMWATCPMLGEAIQCCHEWGFEYKTVWGVWVKACGTIAEEDEIEWGENDCAFGPGRYSGSNAELLLIARQGEKCWHPSTGWKPRQVKRLFRPTDENGKAIHSRKPEKFQDDIDTWLRPSYGMYQPPVELFSTRKRLNWTCIGWDLQHRDMREVLPRLSSIYQDYDLNQYESRGLQLYV